VYVTEAPDALKVGETLPHVAPLQFAPASVQVTPLACESFCTLAENVCVAPPVATLAVVGDTLTVIAGFAVSVIVAPADLVESETDVAVSAIVPDGTAAGAAKTTVAPELLDVGAILPHVAPEQPVPLSDHVTPFAALSFVTVAAKLAVCPTCTDADEGETETESGIGVGELCAGSDGAAPPPHPTHTHTKIDISAIREGNTRRSFIGTFLEEAGECITRKVIVEFLYGACIQQLLTLVTS
jgi:hypothetical protein